MRVQIQHEYTSTEMTKILDRGKRNEKDFA
jgi:hypothetical protein